jgi:hypothetical protein
MKHLVLAVTLLASAVPALAAERLTDRDVKALVARIEDGRDRFDNALDGDLKEKILRGPNGEVKVSSFLNDFQENIDRLEERLKPDYAGSSEAATLLRQGTAIEGFFRSQPAGTKGESEWNRLAADLSTLAQAYGANFPLAANAPIRRIGDGEVVAAADQLSKSAAQLKKSLDVDLKSNPTFNPVARDEIVKEADQWSKDAKVLKERVKDGKPSSAEAATVLTRGAKLQSFVQNNPVPTASSAWPGIAAHTQTLASAYGTIP